MRALAKSRALDVPQSLRAVRVASWRAAPSENGESVCYGTFEPGAANEGEPQWFEVEHATGSDYSGGTVTLSNYRELCHVLAELQGETAGECVWCPASGAYGTYALFVIYERLPEEIREVLDSLDDYPVVNEEALSVLEMELGDDAWQSFGERDMQRALEREFGLDDLELPGPALYDLFRLASERMGHGWEFESGAQPWFDFERAAREVAGALDKRPAWLDQDQHRTLDMLQARISKRGES